MSINIIGTPANFETNVFPLTQAITFGVSTHQVDASSFIDTNVTATLASLPLVSFTSSVNNSVPIAASFDALPLSGFSATVVGTPEQTDTDVTTSTAVLQLTASNAIISATSGTNAFDYRKWGIPYPTDPVPSAIMPTLPTGADYDDHEWVGTYDPCTIENPSHAVIAPNWPSAEQANCYYVDQFDGAATDSANTYGYPDKPRSSIPSAAMSSGSLYLEVHGNNRAYVQGSPQYSQDFDPNTLTGTSGAPVFIVGVDGPWCGRDWTFKGQHVIIDGMKFQERAGGNQFARVHFDDGAKYCCLRNSEVRGSGVSDGGEAVAMHGNVSNAVDFIVTYNCSIHHIGQGVLPQTNADAHCWRPQYWCHWLWCIDNHIYHADGDGVQVSNSGAKQPSDDASSRAHYVYIAGNEFHDFQENCIDNKPSYHVICSKNLCYATDLDPGVSSDDTGIIISNNSEGSNTRWHWFIANETYDCAPAYRYAGNQLDQRSFVINAWIHDCPVAIHMGAYSGGEPEVGVNEIMVNSTVTNCGTGIEDPPDAGGPEVFSLRGNITYNCGATHVENNGRPPTTSELHYHFSYNSDESNAENNAADFTSTLGNEENTDPVFTDPDNDDYTLQATSPCLGVMTTRDAVFTEFNNLYGISIAYDYVGNPIPASNADAGAWQRV